MTWLRELLEDLRRSEPAAMRAHVVVVLGLITNLGVTIPGYVDHWVSVAFAVLTVVAPYYQGLRTRQDVWSQQSVDDLAELARIFPGLAGRAKELLEQGVSKWETAGELQRIEAADREAMH